MAEQHRAKFQPNFYHRPSPNERAARLDPEHASAAEVRSKPASPTSSISLSETGSQERKKKRWGFFRRRDSVTVKKTGKSIAPVLVEDDGEPDDVLEVWFAGCHSGRFYLDINRTDVLADIVLLDVGGGSVSNDTTSCLANIPLRWMIREVVASGCGILFDSSALLRANITLSPEPTSAEIDMDMADAVEPLYDELKLDPLWWLLEIIPLQFTWQDADGVWHREWRYAVPSLKLILDNN